MLLTCRLDRLIGAWTRLATASTATWLVAACHSPDVDGARQSRTTYVASLAHWLGSARNMVAASRASRRRRLPWLHLCPHIRRQHSPGHHRSHQRLRRPLSRQHSMLAKSVFSTHRQHARQTFHVALAAHTVARMRAASARSNASHALATSLSPESTSPECPQAGMYAMIRIQPSITTRTTSGATLHTTEHMMGQQV